MVEYEGHRETDRQAAAAYLRKLADRLAAGEQLLLADAGDGRQLAPAEDVTVDLRAQDGDGIIVTVELGWDPSDDAEPDGTGPDRNGSDEADDAHSSAGWASAGASEGYALPTVDGLDDADNEFERAAYFLRKGKTDAALSRFESAVESHPRDPKRRYQVATACWKTGDPGRAADHFEAAASLATSDPTVQLDYASFLWSRGRIDRAKEVYEHVLDVAPDSADVHSALGRFRWETEGDPKEAVDHLERALTIDGEHALAHLNYAVLLRHGGKHDHAEQHFERALELREGDPIVQKEYGHFLWERGDVEDAAKHYARAE